MYRTAWSGEWIVEAWGHRDDTPTRFSITDENLCCGYDRGMPVTLDYRPPFRFTGTLRRVVVDVSGEPYVDPVAEADLALRSQ